MITTCAADRISVCPLNDSFRRVGNYGSYQEEPNKKNATLYD